MSMFHLQNYTRKERDEVRNFWYSRYHEQSTRPVKMSATSQPEGGYGAWDASSFARELKYKAHSDVKIAKQLDLYKESPEWRDHPVTRAYSERRDAMREERRHSCGADKDRIDLMLNAEAKGYKSWLMEENFGHRTSEPSVKKLLDQTQREKESAFVDLYVYDRKHSHPLTDPNRNLHRDPPDITERRQWMVHREGSDRFGQPTQRKLDSQNHEEMASLGLIPRAWMNEQEDREATRKAPVHSGKIVPEIQEKRVAQRQEVDRLTGTRRNIDGNPIGGDWAEKLRQRTTSQRNEAVVSLRKEQTEIAKKSARQSSVMTSDAREIQSPQSITADNQLSSRLAERRAAAVVNSPQQERRPTLGQQIYQDRMQREAGWAKQSSEQTKTQTREKPQLAPKPTVAKADMPQVSKERAYAERVAARYSTLVSQKSDSVRAAKLASPDAMQRALEIRKHAPKPPQKAQEASRRPINAKPSTPGWLEKVQKRASDFKSEFKQEWKGLVAGISKGKERAAEFKNEVKREFNELVSDASKGLKNTFANETKQVKSVPRNPMASKNVPRSTQAPINTKGPARPVQTTKTGQAQRPTVASAPKNVQIPPQAPPARKEDQRTPSVAASIPLMRGTDAQATSTMAIQLRQQAANGPRANPVASNVSTMAIQYARAKSGPAPNPMNKPVPAQAKATPAPQVKVETVKQPAQKAPTLKPVPPKPSAPPRNPNMGAAAIKPAVRPQVPLPTRSIGLGR